MQFIYFFKKKYNLKKTTILPWVHPNNDCQMVTYILSFQQFLKLWYYFNIEILH
jgi:hypothetical protein